MYVDILTFNPFQENTYLLYDDSGECAIVDPGCYGAAEEQQLAQRIAQLGLKPVLLLNTHCHLDHVFGNAFVHSTFRVLLAYHPLEDDTLATLSQYAAVFGTPCGPSPRADWFLDVDKPVTFGQTQLELRFVPGHSVGHVALVHAPSRQVIIGDLVFRGSVGRVDLPGGNMNTLLHSIASHVLPMPDDYVLHSGHGPATTVGAERVSNPFFHQAQRIASATN